MNLRPTMFRGSVFVVILFVMTSLASQAQSKMEYAYDDAGRVSSVIFTTDNTSRKISYTYDKRSNLTSVETEITVGVQEDKARMTLVVRPNPTATTVTIEVPSASGTPPTLTITTMNGDVVLQRTLEQPLDGTARCTLDTREANMASGNYNVVVSIGEERLSASLVVTR